MYRSIIHILCYHLWKKKTEHNVLSYWVKNCPAFVHIREGQSVSNSGTKYVNVWQGLYRPICNFCHKPLCGKWPSTLKCSLSSILNLSENAFCGLFASACLTIYQYFIAEHSWLCEQLFQIWTITWKQAS